MAIATVAVAGAISITRGGGRLSVWNGDGQNGA
jgi:hypothetical protein